MSLRMSRESLTAATAAMSPNLGIVGQPFATIRAWPHTYDMWTSPQALTQRSKNTHRRQIFWHRKAGSWFAQGLSQWACTTWKKIARNCSANPPNCWIASGGVHQYCRSKIISLVSSCKKKLIWKYKWCQIWEWQTRTRWISIRWFWEKRDVFILSYLKNTNYSTWKCKVADFHSEHGDSRSS